MTHYLVTRCLRRRAPHRSYPYSLGVVELRNAESDAADERKAIEISLGAHGETPVQPDVSAIRTSTIVEAPGPRAAFELAARRIDEALDVLSSTNPMPAFTDYSLMEAGCARDLETGAVVSRLPENNGGEFHLFNSVFLTNQYAYQPRDLAQHVLSTERGELGERYVRASHWARKADLEFNPHMAMLFDWFAAESIWNRWRDDDVIPAIRWSLGFPNGGAQHISSATRRALDSDTLHRSWSGHIEGRLQRIRTIRNQTVHNGFRLLDVSFSEVAGLRKLAHLAVRYAVTCVQQGLFSNIQSIPELVEYLPLLLDTQLHATSKHVIERLQGV
jgi:hypothetical protein